MHWTDRKARASAEVIVDVAVIKINDKLEALRIERQALVERTRPIIAHIVLNNIVREVTPDGQEDTVAIPSGEKATIHPVSCSKSIAALCHQFHPFINSRSAPALAPIDCGGIVTRLQGLQVVGKAVVSITRRGTIFGQMIQTSVSVGAPIIIVLNLRFAPSEVVAIIFGNVSTHIAGRPKSATRQAEVYVIVAVVGVVTTIVFFASCGAK